MESGSWGSSGSYKPKCCSIEVTFYSIVYSNFVKFGGLKTVCYAAQWETLSILHLLLKLLLFVPPKQNCCNYLLSYCQLYRVIRKAKKKKKNRKRDNVLRIKFELILAGVFKENSVKYAYG